jgi:hypothetical protein
MQALNLTHKKFSKLFVLKKALKKVNGHICWKCLCDCGNTTIVNGSHLKNKNTRSCGCYQKYVVTTHGDKRNNYKQLYSIWRSLRNRCDNINTWAYRWYGARGISYDIKWKNYENFKKDMFLKYLYALKQLHIKNLSIERLDNNKNYNFENCIFISKNEQWKNRRNTKGN